MQLHLRWMPRTLSQTSALPPTPRWWPSLFPSLSIEQNKSACSCKAQAMAVPNAKQNGKNNQMQCERLPMVCRPRLLGMPPCHVAQPKGYHIQAMLARTCRRASRAAVAASTWLCLAA